jgi:hypothetical protein
MLDRTSAPGGCHLRPRKPKVVPDAARPNMSRVRWPDGRLSDMTNLMRAKDAVACFIETEERRQRGRHRPSEGRLCVKIDSWGKDSSGLSVNVAEANRSRTVGLSVNVAEANPRIERQCC